MPKHHLYCIIVLSLLTGKVTFCQTLLHDTSTNKAAQQSVIKLYIDSVKEKLHLYNGTEFTAAYRSSAGHPFFEYAEPQEGNIRYDGIHYPGIRLSYDLTRDEVIFVTPSNNLNIKLISQKVSSFSLQDHFFINIRDDSNSVNLREPGFYELTYDGYYSVLVRRKKNLEQSSREENLSKFVQYTDHYARKADTWYLIDNKRTLLALCKDKKREITAYIQKEGLEFKKDPGNTIVKVMEYYTQLKN